jgi:hypothetical protein
LILCVLLTLSSCQPPTPMTAKEASFAALYPDIPLSGSLRLFLIPNHPPLA